MSNGVVFAVAGAKGGVGKTTTSINLCAVLAEVGQDAVLIELDLAMANVADFLDLDVRLEHGRDPTLHDVLSGTASAAAATYEAPGGFDVIPSGVTLQGFASVDFNVVADVVEEARSEYSVVVLDTGAGLGKETLLPLSLADETVLVSSPRVASVRDTKKTRDLVRHVGGSVAGVVFVKSGSGRSPGVDRIADFLSVDLLGHVPEDSAVASAQDIGRPVVVARTGSDAAKAYRALGSHIHERVGTLRAEQTLSEEADENATNDVDTGEVDEPQPATGDEAASESEFTFGEGSSTTEDDDAGDETPESSEATATDTTSDVRSAVDAPLEASPSGARQVDCGEPTATAAQNGDDSAGARANSTTDATESTKSTGSKTGTRVRARQSDITSATRLENGRTDSEQEQVGASDDEIADRLASVDANDDRSGRMNSAVEWSTSDHQSARPQSPADTDTSGAPSVDDETWESKRSATKRFIDKAIDLVDRDDD